MKKLAIFILLVFCLGVSPTITSFNTGQVSWRVAPRMDFEKYKSSLRTAENVLVTTQGPVTRRPGTLFVAAAPTADFNEITRPPVDSNKIGISTPQQLQNMENDLTADYQLLNDIDMTGFDFQPVGITSFGPFTGTLDGRYFTISNLTHLTNVDNLKRGLGLFGYVNGNAVIRRIILTDVSITKDHDGSSHGGLMVGLLSGTTAIITDCYVQGTITCTEDTQFQTMGGFAGSVSVKFEIVKYLPSKVPVKGPKLVMPTG